MFLQEWSFLDLEAKILASDVFFGHIHCKKSVVAATVSTPVFPTSKIVELVEKPLF